MLTHHSERTTSDAHSTCHEVSLDVLGWSIVLLGIVGDAQSGCCVRDSLRELRLRPVVGVGQIHNFAAPSTRSMVVVEVVADACTFSRFFMG